MLICGELLAEFVDLVDLELTDGFGTVFEKNALGCSAFRGTVLIKEYLCGLVVGRGGAAGGCVEEEWDASAFWVCMGCRKLIYDDESQ